MHAWFVPGKRFHAQILRFLDLFLFCNISVWELELPITTKTESKRCIWTAMERTPTRQRSVFNCPPLRSRVGWRSWSLPKHQATSMLIGHHRISFPFGFTVIGGSSISSLETRTELTYWLCTRKFLTWETQKTMSNYIHQFFIFLNMQNSNDFTSQPLINSQLDKTPPAICTELCM